MTAAFDEDDAPAQPVLRTISVAFELEAMEQVALPRYTGATLRGTIGNALRTLTCTTKFETCDGCPQLKTCIYATLWEQPLTPKGFPKRFGDPPRPYILEPIDQRGQHNFLRGERLRFRLKLFGYAMDQVPHIVLAVRDAGKLGFGRGRGRCKLVRAWAEGDRGEETLLYDQGRFHPWGELPEAIITPAPSELDRALVAVNSRLRLRFATPLQLKSRGKVAQQVDLVALTARLTERLDALAFVYESQATTWDHRTLRDAAAAVTIERDNTITERFERFSNRADQRIPMLGMVGDVTVTGASPELIALWRCAEHVHVGKQATFGFGKVCVEIA